MTLHKNSNKFVAKLNRVFWTLLSASCLSVFMSSIAFGQTTVERDQQALTILSQVIAAAGGQNQITSIQDITETGTATFHLDQEVTTNIVVKERGLHQFRMDAELPEGRRSTVVNSAGGRLKEANGQFRPINRQSIADLQSVTFPYLVLIEALQDSSTKIIYGGLITHNGISVYDIRIEKAYTSQQDPIGVRGAREGRDIYIDPKNFLVIAIFDQLHFGSLQDSGVPHEILYSNYQSENGIAMPLTISETVRGMTGSTMQIDQVTFNSGLGDSDFVE
jgi:hypothetical protein